MYVLYAHHQYYLYFMWGSFHIFDQKYFRQKIIVHSRWQVVSQHLSIPKAHSHLMILEFCWILLCLVNLGFSTFVELWHPCYLLIKPRIGRKKDKYVDDRSRVIYYMELQAKLKTGTGEWSLIQQYKLRGVFKRFVNSLRLARNNSKIFRRAFA